MQIINREKISRQIIISYWLEECKKGTLYTLKASGRAMKAGLEAFIV